MTFEAMKQRLAASIIKHTIGEVDYYLQPLSKIDGAAFSAHWRKRGYTDLSVEDKPEDVQEANCFLLSKCLMEQRDSRWTKSCDSDEGRELLNREDLAVVLELVMKIHEISGTGDLDAKKP